MTDETTRTDMEHEEAAAEGQVDRATESGDGAGVGDGDGGGDAEVEALREELESLNERHLRLAAEFDNYRKRNRRDRESLATRLQAELVASLLDVLDDLQRVAGSAEDTSAAAVLEGVRLVEKKFTTVLEGAGLTPVETEGARFDPEVMEAVGMVPTEDEAEDGLVADVFQRGYRIGDVLVRPARVRVYQHGSGG